MEVDSIRRFREIYATDLHTPCWHRRRGYILHEGATLHGQGAGDGGEHGAKELDNLDDEFPVEFH